MTEGDTLVKALADVRQRKAELQSEFDRISTELAKLKLAEKALAAIVEGHRSTPGACYRMPTTAIRELNAGPLVACAAQGPTRLKAGSGRCCMRLDRRACHRRRLPVGFQTSQKARSTRISASW
ncbi:hypothetical protein MPOCJGCO_4874 [Methylobacterium trifolii]|uniref:Uncharacterized protein n=1 Tax=Methylobacterium trifolii TaxID=1003092 RepID=A0ABQ4U6C3_9HYPH|nr:hypothetical protein MPOCJGCO_4874 [Methylobacterium trifolii]